MIVTLIGKNTLYKVKLPKLVVGNYWITDDDGRKLINIEGRAGNWQIKSNSFVQIADFEPLNSVDLLKNISKMQGSVLEKITLSDYSFHCVYFNDNVEEFYILYCYPNFESNYAHLSMKKLDEIWIGSDSNNHIVYKNPLVKQRHARIFNSNGMLMIENLDDTFGTFVNDMPVTNKLKILFNGDVIFIMGLKIVVMGKTIFVNNPLRAASFDKSAFEICKELEDVEILEDETEEDVEIYTDENYFARAPKITNKIECEKIKIDKPPENQDKPGNPVILSIGATMGMGIIMVISSLMAVDGITSGTASFGRIFASCFTSVAMLICMILFPILNNRYDKHKKKKTEKTRQTRYIKYINSKIKQINDTMKKQETILFENYPSAEECAKIVINKDSRLWERKTDDDEFLAVRLGTGNVPLEAEIDYPNIEFTMEDDNLVDALNTVVNKSKVLENVPIAINLAQKNIAGLVVDTNNEKLEEKFVQNFIMQLVALQSYDDLKLVFFITEDRSEKWAHMKSLPHIWDNTKTLRFWASDYNDMKEISAFLEKEFSSRAEKIRDDKTDYKAFKPYYLIITNDYKTVQNLTIVSDILNVNRNIGFGLFCITNNIFVLPNECENFITLDGDKGTVFENEITEDTKRDFYFDMSYTFFFERIGNVLSNIQIKSSSQDVMSLPDSYTFLEMFDCGKIEQLNILNRWKTNDATVSLATPIGIDPAGMEIDLDIHEKAHGPHGLIAGTTGSGKSEFIITYVLSLCVNYNPDDVAFILIDYKGGGLAGAFKKNDVVLPHLAGTITNIDTNGLQRSLVSIQSELRRRQVLFNEARDKTDGGTIDIYKYQRLYKDKVVDEPIPHLLIICDEFAELKQQQPDFMDELVSVARIGRSLGVHLILATQKPSGVVNDQIRSNSKFGICLKVQDKSDSNDIIGRPDAAELKKSGQFYMQVGNDEYFTLGQSGWSGAPYVPSDRIKKTVDSSLKFLSDTGTVIKEVDNGKKKNDKAEGEQLTRIVKYLSDIAKHENISTRQLWLDDIPETIYLKDVKEKYNVKQNDGNISPVFGEFDDPYNQRQGVLQLDLSNQGNTIIYGNADSGKETLLSTILYDMMTSYSANDVWTYILDFGSETLKAFKNAPIVGDVIFSNDVEKIARLYEMLQRELKERTKILSDYGGDYKLYVKSKENIMPMIVVIINNFEVYNENYEDEYEDLLLTLSREGEKAGIMFILTASSANAVRYRLGANFREKIALQLNNDDEFLNIFEKIGKKRPAHIFGRGLIKREDIYEFQTAKVCEPEEWNSFIRNEAEKQKNKADSFAERIPVLPDKVEFEDVKEYLNGLDAVPLGISKNLLNVDCYDFKKNVVNIISGKDIETVVIFVQQLMEEFKHLKKVKIVTLDAEQIIIEKNFNEEYKKFVTSMANNEDTDKNVVCIIIGLNKFLANAEDGEEGFLKVLQTAENLKNYNFILVDNFSKLKSHEYNTWYKDYILGDRGIWVGSGINDQLLIRTNANRRDLENDCGNSFGYAVNRETPTLIKLLGMDDNREDN